MKKILAPLILAIICGCGKEPSSAPFAIVNGHALTEGEVRGIVLVKIKMQELSGRNIDRQRFANLANSCAAAIIPGLISAEILDCAVKESRSRPTEEDREKVLASYNRACGCKGRSLEQLTALFGEEGKVFRSQFERSVNLQAFKREHLAADVSDAEVSTYLSGKTNELRFAENIDAKARRKGEEAYALLKKGESWESVAKNFSEDILISERNGDFYREWAVLDSTAFGYAELANELPLLKVGEYSKPIETEEGLMIVKVNSIEDGRYDLGRIIFRMAEPVDIPPPEEARRLLAKDKSNKMQLDLLARLREKAKIEYPRGTNFVVTIWKDAVDNSGR